MVTFRRVKKKSKKIQVPVFEQGLLPCSKQTTLSKTSLSFHRRRTGNHRWWWLSVTTNHRKQKRKTVVLFTLSHYHSISRITRTIRNRIWFLYPSAKCSNQQSDFIGHYVCRSVCWSVCRSVSLSVSYQFVFQPSRSNGVFPVLLE